MPKVFVSGCFDVLHSGHIAFLEEAATYGDVYVSIGSDETVRLLKNRSTMYTEQERKYMLEAIRFVKKVYIGPDTGKILDFAPLLDEVKPDIFFVNSDGTSDAKKEFVESKGIRYVTSSRIPHADLPERSTTSIRQTIGK